MVPQGLETIECQKLLVFTVSGIVQSMDWTVVERTETVEVLL